MKRSARPASSACPRRSSRHLDADQARLYELIWKRAVASQMESAELERTTVDAVSADGKITLRATGTVTLFDGFLTLYQEGKDDEDDENGAKLPKVKQGEALRVENVIPAQHFTEPPPRYSEASLVRKMEELGIGRPSTYASILSTLRDRAYVRMDRNRFIPEDKGRLVTSFLESFFRHYVEYDFTADLEEKLDEVSAGDLGWKQLLRDFWDGFSAAIGETKDLKITDVINSLNDSLRAAYLPGEHARRGPAQMPGLRRRRTEPEARPFRRLCRLLELSRMPLHPPARPEAPKMRATASRRNWARIPKPAKPSPCAPAASAPSCSAAKRRSPSAPASPRASMPADVDLEYALKLLEPAARSRHPSRNRQADRRPISAASGPICCMTAAMPRWKRPKTCSRSASTAPSP